MAMTQKVYSGMEFSFLTLKGVRLGFGNPIDSKWLKNEPKYTDDNDGLREQQMNALMDCCCLKMRWNPWIDWKKYGICDRRMRFI